MSSLVFIFTREPADCYWKVRRNTKQISLSVACKRYKKNQNPKQPYNRTKLGLSFGGGDFLSKTRSIFPNVLHVLIFPSNKSLSFTGCPGGPPGLQFLWVEVVTSADEIN